MPKVGSRRKRADTPRMVGSAGPSSAMDDSSSGGEEPLLRSPPRSLKKTTKGAMEVWKEERVTKKVRRDKSGESGGEGVPKMGEEGVRLGAAGSHMEKFRRNLEALRKGAVKSGSNTERSGVSGVGGYVSELKRITASFSGAVFDTEGVSMESAKKLLNFSSEYEEFSMRLVAEIAHLRGQVDALQKIREETPRRTAGAVPAGPVSMPAPQAPMPAPVLPALPVPKPVETWSVVVRGKTPITSKEVISKVVKEVGPSMGVRVHELKPLRDGGAIIRTPSVVEREKLAKKSKFSKVGLDVSVRQKMGPKVVVQGVHTEISPDEFMGELFRLNLREFSPECLEKDVRMVSRPWKVGSDGVTNVVLEGTDKLMSALLEAGRCYVKWVSFRVRPDQLTRGCFRCMGFDHRVAECKAKKDVCRRCGQEGHMSARCGNPPHCRNCAFKGKPAAHLMMSTLCPIYCSIVARALARH